MSPGWLTCFLTVAVPLSLLLPITLLVLAACSHARHSTRVGEVVWAIVLFALVFPWVLYALRARTTTTGDGLTIVGWRRTEVPWGEIQLFVGKTTTNSGRPPRTEALAVMTKAGKRLPVPSAVRRVAIGSATALNQAFGLGYQLRYCQRCHQQYEVGGACSHHPAAPVSLGQISDGAAAREPWIYPCCGRAVLAAIGPQGETIPPARYPGCQTTEHAPVIRW